MTIFEVADVQAVDLWWRVRPCLPMRSRSPLLEVRDTIARIDLDTPLSLNASVGTAGYAIQVTGDDSIPGWEWLRTVSSTTPPGVTSMTAARRMKTALRRVQGWMQGISRLRFRRFRSRQGVALVLLGGLVLTFRRKR